MARYQRDLSSSQIFHVTNRGNDRQDIFSVEADRHQFEANLDLACSRYGIRVLAYAWMTNHHHQIVQCEDPSALPPAMCEFQSRYARGYNLRADRTGSLFERPYFSKAITNDSHLLQSARYVHRNPIDVVGPGRLAAYPWSSLGVYLGHRNPQSWMAVEPLSGLIDASRYLDRLRGAHHWDRLPIDQLPPLVRTTFDEVDAAVVAVLEGATHEHRRGVAMLTAANLRVGSALDIAEWHGLHAVTARTMLRRLRVEASTDAAFQATVDVVVDVLAYDTPG